MSVKMGKFYFFQVFSTCNLAIRNGIRVGGEGSRQTMDGIHDLQTAIQILVPETFKYELEVCWKRIKIVFVKLGGERTVRLLSESKSNESIESER